LTNQLLIFGRKKVTCPTVLNLNDVIVNMLKMLRRVIGEHIDLVVDLAETLEAVEVDQGQVEQVILNLVVNARDAMPEGGQLVLHTENVTLDEADKLRQSGIEPGAYVMLSVRDTGVGMDDEIQAHIFEPFFTTKEQGIGGGLGLSIVYGIVTQSEGHIAVQSEVGQGTTFFVYLPRAAQAVQTKKSQPADEKGLDGTETILLVEDEDVVRDLARRALERRGYTVLAPRLPKQALRLMQQYVGPVSLLVTDVVMPEMNGRELAAQITALRPNIRVLYISGYTDDVISTHGVLEQGIVLLPKPFGPKELVQKVRQVLDGG